MSKTEKMKKATSKTRWGNFKQWCKKIILFPIRAIKWLWRLICRICRAIWNWLKSIDIVGMVNLTLLVAIIVLFVSLISNFVCCKKLSQKVVANNVATTQIAKGANVSDRKVVKRKYTNASATVLPIKVNSETNIRPQIRTIGVEKPEVVAELSIPAAELPQQVLSGDVIVERAPNSPILSNGVKIDGNLFIQNMRKYTLPCDAKINGHLFIRNVQKLSFCGKFKVNGNVYVNRESSFGAFPEGAKINGQIIL